MNKKNQIQVNDESLFEDNKHIEIEQSNGLVEIGQWYWVKDTNWKKETYEWLGCVNLIGSNFIELHEPRGAGGRSYIRVHFNDFQEILRFEPNSKQVIAEKVKYYQGLSNQYLAEVKEITARLGLSSHLSIESPDTKHNTALTVLSGQADVKDYENALIKAKKEDLPALFEKLKKTHEHVAKWMAAESVALEAVLDQMKESVNEIDDKIFNVSLYAGLTENVCQIAEGKPADFSEKLRVMQRRLYMDEECLLNYRHGGMEFTEIGEFDTWLSEPENRDRILPFERCMVAMRIRRNRKGRESNGSLRDALINFQFDQANKMTFMYIRNGENLYRMDCELDFGEMIFPDKSMFDAGEPLMVKMFANRVDQMMSVREYEHLVAEQNRNKKLYDQWLIDNPDPNEGKSDGFSHHYKNPYRNYRNLNEHEWKPFDHSNVYFDDCMQVVADKIKQYNRIAFIIQGLFDRSKVLHPHPPVKTWEPQSFSNSVELVFDANMILPDGEKPDFDAYKARCNASMDANSIVVGQELYWMKKEAEKECRRMDASWRERDSHRPTLFKPYGNPGPGYIAKLKNWKPKSRVATFSWYRERLVDTYEFGRLVRTPILTTLNVPADELFNISAYKLGDYKQFFKDPRTREQYLQWAPMLIAAEEYCAGKAIPCEPV